MLIDLILFWDKLWKIEKQKENLISITHLLNFFGLELLLRLIRLMIAQFNVLRFFFGNSPSQLLANVVEILNFLLFE